VRVFCAWGGRRCSRWWCLLRVLLCLSFCVNRGSSSASHCTAHCGMLVAVCRREKEGALVFMRTPYTPRAPTHLPATLFTCWPGGGAPAVRHACMPLYLPCGLARRWRSRFGWFCPAICTPACYAIVPACLLYACMPAASWCIALWWWRIGGE
jgi:hypothetical protein